MVSERAACLRVRTAFFLTDFFWPACFWLTLFWLSWAWVLISVTFACAPTRPMPNRSTAGAIRSLTNFRGIMAGCFKSRKTYQALVKARFARKLEMDIPYRLLF